MQVDGRGAIKAGVVGGDVRAISVAQQVKRPVGTELFGALGTHELEQLCVCFCKCMYVCMCGGLEVGEVGR